MKWTDIEIIGRATYNLSDEWHLVAADASDEKVMKIEFGKKGPRGGWLKGSENRFEGFLVDYKNLSAKTDTTVETKQIEEQLELFD